MGREILLVKSYQQRCGRKYHIADEFRPDIAKDTPGGQITRCPISWGPLYASPLRGARA